VMMTVCPVSSGIMNQDVPDTGACVMAALLNVMRYIEMVRDDCR